ncbi:hypothetical protein GMSM_38490 [Geomonas sp. Red276]
MSFQDPTDKGNKNGNGKLEALEREKEALSQQVKSLIKAEGKLYEFQEKLDAQLKEYRELYDFNRQLHATFEIDQILRLTVAYIVEHLEFERAVSFRRGANGEYRVCAHDGYYDPADEETVKTVTFPASSDSLSPLFAGGEFILCHTGCADPDLAALGENLKLNDFLIYPVGHPDTLYAFIVIGNSAENAVMYRSLAGCAPLLSIGNVVGVLSAVIESRIFYEELEKSREQERLAEAKYRGIFENAVEGIYQRSPQGRYLDANRSLARTFGFDSARELMEEVSSIRDDLYVDPSDHDRLMALIAEREAVEGYETRMYRKDGRVIWVSISMRAVRGADGSIVCYEGATEEITERKQAEEALRESEKRYRQLSEALEQRVKEAVDEIREKDRILILQGRQAVMGEMISNIAHQWRQPLNMLALLVQELQITQQKEGLTEEFVVSNVGRSLEIIKQMSKTIDYFRYFFRPDKEKVPFRVLESLEKTVAILDGSFRSHNIEITLATEGDPVVEGFPTEFVQVLLNILINARDALVSRKPPAPRIAVRMCAEDGKTVVTVADNAGGVPEAIIDRIFDPYFTTKGPEQGTGIGLFMCKTIVEKNMGGRLSVRNTGEGAEFRIEI